MIAIELQAIPNQSFSIRLNGDLYDIEILEANGVMCSNVSRNNELILSGDRIVPGYPIIPYQYLSNGNLVLLTANGDYPYYTQFGVTQSLIFASASEIEALNAGV
jgi:hypothetical protein